MVSLARSSGLNWVGPSQVSSIYMNLLMSDMINADDIIIVLLILRQLVASIPTECLGKATVFLTEMKNFFPSPLFFFSKGVGIDSKGHM